MLVVFRYFKLFFKINSLSYCKNLKNQQLQEQTTCSIYWLNMIHEISSVHDDLLNENKHSAHVLIIEHSRPMKDSIWPHSVKLFCLIYTKKMAGPIKRKRPYRRTKFSLILVAWNLWTKSKIFFSWDLIFFHEVDGSTKGVLRNSRKMMKQFCNAFLKMVPKWCETSNFQIGMFHSNSVG